MNIAREVRRIALASASQDDYHAALQVIAEAVWPGCEPQKMAWGDARLEKIADQLDMLGLDPANMPDEYLRLARKQMVLDYDCEKP